MKVSIVVIALLVCIFPIFAQPSSQNIHFGFAATLEKSTDVYTDGFHSRTEIGFSKVLFPIMYRSFLKIQPELGYNSQTYKDFSYRMWQYGIGIYYCLVRQRMRFYLGPRLGYEKLRSSVFSNNDEMTTATYKDYGLTIGSEYLFGSNMTCGAEVRFNRYHFKEPGFDFERIHYALIPSLYLAFYFK